MYMLIKYIIVYFSSVINKRFVKIIECYYFIKTKPAVILHQK